MNNEERLEIKYIPVAEATLWDENPKQHDLGAIMMSIEKNGFRDPPSYDATLGALIEGNGRATALRLMELDNKPVPRGIIVDRQTGEWLMPINFGVNALTKEMAWSYAIDHNNLTMIGGDFTLYDISRMWDDRGLQHVLSNLVEGGEHLVSFDDGDINAIIDNFSHTLYNADDDRAEHHLLAQELLSDKESSLEKLSQESDDADAEPAFTSEMEKIFLTCHADEIAEFEDALKDWIKEVASVRWKSVRLG